MTSPYCDPRPLNLAMYLGSLVPHSGSFSGCSPNSLFVDDHVFFCRELVGLIRSTGMWKVHVSEHATKRAQLVLIMFSVFTLQGLHCCAPATVRHTHAVRSAIVIIQSSLCS